MSCSDSLAAAETSSVPTASETSALQTENSSQAKPAAMAKQMTAFQDHAGHD